MAGKFYGYSSYNPERRKSSWLVSCITILVRLISDFNTEYNKKQKWAWIETILSFYSDNIERVQNTSGIVWIPRLATWQFSKSVHIFERVRISWTKCYSQQANTCFIQWVSVLLTNIDNWGQYVMKSAKLSDGEVFIRGQKPLRLMSVQIYLP